MNRALIELIERFERDGIRFSVTTVHEIECVFCGAGFSREELCRCKAAREHRMSQMEAAVQRMRAK